MTMKFRTPYDDSLVQPQVVFDAEEGLTKQSFKDECDVNRIMARYADTGVIEHIRESPPSNADVSDVGTYQEAMDIVSHAQSQFMQLPSAVRAAFDNDPVAFLDAFESAEGQDLLRQHGVLPQEAPSEERPATETVPAPAGATGGEPDGVPGSE